VVATKTFAPDGLNATQSFGKIDLSWNEPANSLDDGELTYSVYRGTTPGGGKCHAHRNGSAGAELQRLRRERRRDVTTTKSPPHERRRERAEHRILHERDDNAHGHERRRRVLHPPRCDRRVRAILRANNPNGSALYTLPYASVTSYTINALDGDDAIYIDVANGSPIPAAGATVTGGAGTIDAINVIGNRNGADRHVQREHHRDQRRRRDQLHGY
jgi:hypothetical protein